MIRIFSTLIVLIFFLSFANAQDTTLQNIDAKTYKLYTEKDWHSLIKLSKKTLKNDIDYYYLRMRLGIAYYEQHRYNLAYQQFKKAKQFDDNDLLNEYLYYSYFLGGNYAKAEELSNNFNDSLKMKLEITKPKKIISAEILYAALINESYHNLKDFRIDDTIRFTLNNRIRNSYNYFYGANVKFRLNKNFSSTISYGKLIENKTQIIQDHDYLQDTSAIEEYNNDTKQGNLYFNLVYSSLKFNWFVGLNFVHVSDNYIKLVPFEPEYQKEEVAEKYTDAIINAGFTVNTTFFAVGLNASAANLGAQRQLQFGGNLYLYPKANKNIVIYAEPIFQNISEKVFISQGRRGYYERGTLENNFVIKTGFTSKIYKSFFINLNAYFGRLNQFNDDIGYLVFNDIDVITSLYSARLSFNITKKLSAFVSYSYSEREHEYQTINYLIPPTVIDESGIINITNQSIIGGLKWSF